MRYVEKIQFLTVGSRPIPVLRVVSVNVRLLSSILLFLLNSQCPGRVMNARFQV